MNKFRIFIAMLLLLALPVQGVAAARMLMCGVSHHNAPVAAQPSKSADAHADCLEHASQTTQASAASPDAHQANQSHQSHHAEKSGCDCDYCFCGHAQGLGNATSLLLPAASAVQPRAQTLAAAPDAPLYLAKKPPRL